jgi:hypothetical protein
MSTTPMGEQEQSPSAPNAGTNTSGVPACLATILGQPRAVAGFCEGQLVLADGTCFNVEFCQQKHLHPPIPEAELVKRRLVLVSEIQKTGHGGLAIQFPLGTGAEGGPAATDLERQRKERKADVEFALLRNGGASGVAALAWFFGMQTDEEAEAGTWPASKQIEIQVWPPILLSRFETASPTPRSLDFLRQATAVPVNCAALEQVVGELKITAQALAKERAKIVKLYSEPAMAEVHKRAFGQGVPVTFINWALAQFLDSGCKRLPTIGQAMREIRPETPEEPETPLGKGLMPKGRGKGRTVLAGHLTVLRRLLITKGLPPEAPPGKARKRAPGYDPASDRHEDINQPTPYESAADRDDARTKVDGLAPDGD